MQHLTINMKYQQCMKIEYFTIKQPQSQIFFNNMTDCQLQYVSKQITIYIQINLDINISWANINPAKYCGEKQLIPFSNL